MALHKGEEHEITRNHWDHKGVFLLALIAVVVLGTSFVWGISLFIKNFSKSVVQRMEWRRRS